MKKSLLLFLLAFASIIAQAQIPNGYYNNAANKTGDDLKVALHNIIKGHHQVSYAGLLDAYAYTDCKANGKIWDIYSNYEFSLSGSCGSYEKEGDCWNREHTWPQSWFNQQSIPRSDLFHVYPTDGYVNNRRSNYPYGEVNNPTYTSGNGSKLGPCVTTGYSGTVFEPINEYKGDIARSYFYMSVRYYSEDSNWGTSDMTNKSEILPWAMTMLLRWSDEDPVSDKEIARNNAVYGYQNNRNPFIDHPEYARMIWDPSWTGGNSYNITCATGLSHGSVSAPETAMEGTTVAIIATPAAGYMVSAYSVYKTGSPSTTVSVSSNGTFTMPGYDITVSATFAQNTQLYTITQGTVSHGSINISTTSALSGATVTMTATPDNGHSLYSWYVYKTTDINTSVTVANPNSNNASFTMPAFNVTVMATFAQGSSGNGDYVKVTTAPSDWSGEYLIVYETGSKAFDGSLSSLDTENNTISVTITGGNTIAFSDATNAAKFTIATMTGGYSIQAASGKYIGNASNSNSLTSNDSPMLNTISYGSNSVNIVSSGGAYLRYNANSGQERFRYFKSSTYSSQQAIQLYKKIIPTPTHTIYFNSNGGSGTMSNQTVNEMTATPLNANTSITRDGFEFSGWNTAANGTGTYYADGATVTLLEDLTLYAQWDPLFTVTCATGLTGGTISATPTSATEGTTITLTATPDTGYELDHWTVVYGQENIDVENNQFEMPASNVTVSATFTEQSVVSGDFEKVTENLSDWSGEYLIVYETGNVAFNGGLDNLDDASNTINVTISGNKIEANTTTLSAKFTIAPTTGGYSIQSASGKYIGHSGTSNNISTSTTALKNTISISSNNAIITAADNTYTLKYNSSSGQTRFRYYSSGQQSIQLYKRVSAAPTTYTVTFHPNGGTGSDYTQTVNANEATALTANTFTRSDYVFSGWNTQADGTGTAYTNQQTVTLTADLDLYAQWTSQSTSHTYHLVTSTDQLVAGRTYLIVNTANKKALGTTQNNNNRSAASVTVGSNMISNIGDDVCELTLGGQSGAWTFYDATKNGYLCATSGSNNYLRTQTTLDNYGKWTITLDASHNATIKTIASGAGRHTIMYNDGNTIFSCYASGQTAVQLYIRSENDITQNTTYQNLVLFDFDQCTIHSGVTLTVTGTASCTDHSKLIIEEGGQLIHHNDGVKATFKKSITAYANANVSDGWYTIATPFASYTPEGNMISDDYDLYAYDEGAANGKEWINYESGNFDLSPGTGYLYAHNPGVTLNMTGTLNSGDYTQTVNLSFANNSHESIKGWNLLGNPTAHDITFTKTGSVSDGYYYVVNSGSFTYEPTNTVPAGRGFFVKANASGQSVTLNPPAKRGEVEKQDIASFLRIDVDGEQAYVKLTEGVSMPLLDFRGKHSSVYLTRENKPYIMLVRDEADAIDLCYQPQHSGQHQLNVTMTLPEPLTAHLSSLTLIDRLTGTNINLLETPSYSFESKNDDFTSRFKLVFVEGEDNQDNLDDDDNFAFISNGNLIVNGTGTLQIFDILGHQLFVKQVSTPHSSLLTPHFPTGVYMLRLITPEKVKVQKIVIN